MRTADYPEVAPDFGHWLAGFIDGEGCFIIGAINKVRADYETFHPWFAMKVRDDDAAIIEEIHGRTGIGAIYRRSGSGNSNPMISWHVSNRADCTQLVAILDQFPLRAKKARDYAIWREAVILRNGLQHGVLAGRRPGGEPIRLPGADWSEMRALREQLQDQRRYSEG